MRRLGVIGLFFVALFVATAVRAENDKVRIAVMALQASSAIPAEFVQSLTALVPEELERLGPFKALSTHDINQMLAYEGLKDQLGCTDVTCLAELGGALGVTYIITGSVTLVADTYLVQLQWVQIL